MTAGNKSQMPQSVNDHTAMQASERDGGLGAITLLGFCDRAEIRTPTGEAYPVVSIINLRGADLFPIFPILLKGLNLVLGIHRTADEGTYELILESEEDGRHVLKIDIVLEYTQLQPHSTTDPRFIRDWEILPIELPQGAVIFSPGSYRVTIKGGGERKEIGTIKFLFVEIPPLTVSQANAIRSNPLSSEMVRMSIGCSACDKHLQFYAALEGKLSVEPDSYTWYQDLPERFACGCGQISFETLALRKNFHYYLLFDRASASRNERLELTRLYDRSAIEDTIRCFVALLDSATCEEEIQSFISSNKILLAQFSPREVLVKPSLLSKYRADFGIVNQRGELMLIELERANCKLMKKDGGVHSELQKALDQTRSWKSIVEDHRSAVLEMMGLESHKISRVRMVVVAGRRQKYRVQDLRTLIGGGLGDADFYTYDDLVEAVLTQARLWAEL